MRAALGLIRSLTLQPEEFGADDIGRARQGGLEDDDILDAVQICAAFNIIDRVADAMAFAVRSEQHFAVDARIVRRIGYGLPALVGRLMRERVAGCEARA